jgi:hypothetical protein
MLEILFISDDTMQKIIEILCTELAKLSPGLSYQHMIVPGYTIKAIGPYW